ncbi:hypothetical protein ACH5RR_028495 [Cinchona calisaya]|uniref:non-specific serine/threonine protein kinase n=1 Tax=Cinchona calisaya TaxID=153742 RepID=A0ABD2YSN8_9GENT
MPTSILSSGCFATRVLILTPADFGVLTFLVSVLVVAVIFRRIVSLVIIACVFIICCGSIYILKVCKEGKRGEVEEKIKPSGLADEEKDSTVEIPALPMRFSYEELRTATRHFEEKLGSGGFGSVFKGTLEDGTLVAVKRLEKLSQNMKEFLAEVRTIGSIHHFNLVKLIGYCKDKSYRLLVYEFVANGSLDKWIFYQDRNNCLKWQIRKNIAIDIAKGLAYLHEECYKKIIHLDIKPQNILLDENFNAKVSDFGLSKLMDRDKSQVVTTMRGTPGYMAPEWRLSKITEKVDVYSFGIVLLEIICRRRNFDGRSETSSHLLRLLQSKSKNNKLLHIVRNFDEDMKNNAEEVERMIKIAAWCLQDDHTRRPCMSTLVNVLEGVMEVDSNMISFNFKNALADHHVLHINDDPSPSPLDFVLSNPR